MKDFLLKKRRLPHWLRMILKIGGISIFITYFLFVFADLIFGFFHRSMMQHHFPWHLSDQLAQKSDSIEVEYNEDNFRTIYADVGYCSPSTESGDIVIYGKEGDSCRLNYFFWGPYHEQVRRVVTCLVPEELGRVVVASPPEQSIEEVTKTVGEFSYRPYGFGKPEFRLSQYCEHLPTRFEKIIAPFR